MNGIRIQPTTAEAIEATIKRINTLAQDSGTEDIIRQGEFQKAIAFWTGKLLNLKK